MANPVIISILDSVDANLKSLPTAKVCEKIKNTGTWVKKTSCHHQLSMWMNVSPLTFLLSIISAFFSSKLLFCSMLEICFVLLDSNSSIVGRKEWYCCHHQALIIHFCLFLKKFLIQQNVSFLAITFILGLPFSSDLSVRPPKRFTGSCRCPSKVKCQLGGLLIIPVLSNISSFQNSSLEESQSVDSG